MMLFGIGLGALALLAFTLARRGPRLPPKSTRPPSAAVAEYETLSDRMWELQESEERFRGLIDALGDLVVHRDRDGRIVYANRVFADLSAASRPTWPAIRLPSSASMSASFPTPPSPTANA